MPISRANYAYITRKLCLYHPQKKIEASLEPLWSIGLMYAFCRLSMAYLYAIYIRTLREALTIKKMALAPNHL